MNVNEHLSMLKRKDVDVAHRLMNTTIWDEVPLRDGDIIISSWMKSGTTWLQQIIAQLIFANGKYNHINDISPWVDTTCNQKKEFVLKKIEAQTHRRFLKTHAPASAMNIYKEVRYIYIARDGRDVAWSLFNHLTNSSLEDQNTSLNRDPRGFFLSWLRGNGYPMWSYWEHIESWWNCRHMKNVLLIHYQNLLDDLPRQVASIADFIGIQPTPDILSTTVAHSRFAYMHEHAEQFIPEIIRNTLRGGPKTFIYKGTNGRWMETLSDADCAEYEKTAAKMLETECAEWLRTGNTT